MLILFGPLVSWILEVWISCYFYEVIQTSASENKMFKSMPSVATDMFSTAEKFSIAKECSRHLNLWHGKNRDFLMSSREHNNSCPTSCTRHYDVQEDGISSDGKENTTPTSMTGKHWISRKLFFTSTKYFISSRNKRSDLKGNHYLQNKTQSS